MDRDDQPFGLPAPHGGLDPPLAGGAGLAGEGEALEFIGLAPSSSFPLRRPRFCPGCCAMPSAAGLSPGNSTLLPSRSLSAPSVTTISPACSPLVTATRSPSLGPAWIL